MRYVRRTCDENARRKRPDIFRVAIRPVHQRRQLAASGGHRKVQKSARLTAHRTDDEDHLGLPVSLILVIDAEDGEWVRLDPQLGEREEGVLSRLPAAGDFTLQRYTQTLSPDALDTSLGARGGEQQVEEDVATSAYQPVETPYHPNRPHVHIKLHRDAVNVYGDQEHAAANASARQQLGWSESNSQDEDNVA